MRKIEHSPGLERALAAASTLAGAQGCAAFEERHLLQALIHDRDGLACSILVDAGLDLSRLPAPEPIELEASAADATGEAGQTLPPAPSVASILRHARDLTRWLSPEGTVTTDLVLLALLEHDPTARAGLVAVGLDWDALRASHPQGPPPLTLDEPLPFEAPRRGDEVARILDAAANRAREALRVLEDHARFVLDDSFLTRQVKEMRHGLAGLLEPWAAQGLQARDAIGDVGAQISTPREASRDSAAAVVLANAKRLQESLRSLEEYGKTLSPELAAALEQLRYRAYALESALIRPGANERLRRARLYLLLGESQCSLSWQGTAREALEGGVDILQLREKDLDDRTLLERARTLRAMTRDHDALFFVNDRPDIAFLAEADGVHLGQEDLTPRAARRILGPDALIGVSSHNIEQLRRAILDNASCLGIGPTFPSRTKAFADLAGLPFIREACAETSLPAFALGGITLENLPQVLAAGARRVAVSHAICAAAEPRDAARRFRALLAAADT